MTTIAYRDGVLAADSRGTCSDWIIPGVEQKLYRLKDGRPAAVTGGLSTSMKLFEWVESDRKTDQPTGSCRVIVLCPEGGVEIFEDGHHYREHAPFNAWGSGMPVAFGALHAGATAREAVRIAGKVDPSTGGPVVWMQCQ